MSDPFLRMWILDFLYSAVQLLTYPADLVVFENVRNIRFIHSIYSKISTEIRPDITSFMLILVFGSVTWSNPASHYKYKSWKKNVNLLSLSSSLSTSLCRLKIFTKGNTCFWWTHVCWVVCNINIDLRFIGVNEGPPVTIFSYLHWSMVIPLSASPDSTKQYTRNANISFSIRTSSYQFSFDPKVKGRVTPSHSFSGG